MTRLAVALLAAALATSPASAQAPQPFADAAARPANADEQRVWDMGDEFDAMLRKSGRLLDDERVQAYVQEVSDRLFPEFKGRLRVRVVRSPQLNAFALPNGSLYINEGLLARFENEGQLATVLAHEGAHFTHRHSFQQQQSVRSAAAAGTFLAILGIPVLSPLAQVLALSSVFGFSRELEAEADRVGFERLVAAGYDPRDGPRVFDHLAKETKAAEIQEPWFFSTHPKLQERFDSFTRLAATVPPPATTPQDAYQERIGQLRVRNLENELSAGRFRQLIVVLTDPEQLRLYPPFAPYYLGEAYRMRSDKGDAELAERAWREALAAAPGFAPTYRALGMHYLKQEDYAQAADFLERFLALAKSPAERAYAESYLQAARDKVQR
jgi:predicted Zn-dependent protease